MFRPKDTQERVLHRLKIVQGHLGKVINMVQSQKYCIDVIYQSQAVQKALQEIDTLMLENHLKTCATEAIKNNRSKKAVSEVINVFRKGRL